MNGFKCTGMRNRHGPAIATCLSATLLCIELNPRQIDEMIGIGPNQLYE